MQLGNLLLLFVCIHQLLSFSSMERPLPCGYSCFSYQTNLISCLIIKKKIRNNFVTYFMVCFPPLLCCGICASLHGKPRWKGELRICAMTGEVRALRVYDEWNKLFRWLSLKIVTWRTQKWMMNLWRFIVETNHYQIKLYVEVKV